MSFKQSENGPESSEWKAIYESLQLKVAEEYCMYGYEGQFRRDVLMWYHMLASSPPDLSNILRRLLTVIRWGGLMIKSSSGNTNSHENDNQSEINGDQKNINTTHCNVNKFRNNSINEDRKLNQNGYHSKNNIGNDLYTDNDNVTNDNYISDDNDDELDGFKKMNNEQVSEQYLWKWWAETGWPIVCALSHGGRILIQLPTSDTDETDSRDLQFWSWLLTGSKTGKVSSVLTTSTGGGPQALKEGKLVFRRLCATHAVEYEKESDKAQFQYKLNQDGQYLEVIPTKKISQSYKNKISSTSIPTNNLLNIEMGAYNDDDDDDDDDESEEHIRNVFPGSLPPKQSIINPSDLDNDHQNLPRSFPHCLPFGRSKVLKEVKTWGVHYRDTKILRSESYMIRHHRHWGMNIALGNFNSSSFNGNIIKNDGCNGHVYFYVMAGKPDRHGALMVGIEGSEYGLYSNSSGEYHGLSAKSSSLSVTYGYKWCDDCAKPENDGKSASKKHNPSQGNLPLHDESLCRIGGPLKCDGMFIDLSVTGWEFLIEKYENEWSDDLLFETSLQPSKMFGVADKFSEKNPFPLSFWRKKVDMDSMLFMTQNQKLENSVLLNSILDRKSSSSSSMKKKNTVIMKNHANIITGTLHQQQEESNSSSPLTSHQSAIPAQQKVSKFSVIETYFS